MVDKLFGSKTRVKLLHLFLNNPDNSFYVREITRLIGEQINSVRRELSNMLAVGIIESDTSDNKLYYRVNKLYEHYSALSMIFSDTSSAGRTTEDVPSRSGLTLSDVIAKLTGVRIAVLTGSLVKGANSPVDILLVGDVNQNQVKRFIKDLETAERRDINYSILTYDEFYYRMSVKDKFITEILNNNHKVAVDTDNVLKG